MRAQFIFRKAGLATILVGAVALAHSASAQESAKVKQTPSEQMPTFEERYSGNNRQQLFSPTELLTEVQNDAILPSAFSKAGLQRANASLLFMDFVDSQGNGWWCSAVAVSPDTLLTTSHCVTRYFGSSGPTWKVPLASGTRLQVHLVRGGIFIDQEVLRQVRANPWSAEVVVDFPPGDLLVLRLATIGEAPPFATYAPISFAPLQTGEPIYNLGYAIAAQSKPPIKPIVRLGQVIDPASGVDYFCSTLVSPFIVSGDSGGGLFDWQGNLRGLLDLDLPNHGKPLYYAVGLARLHEALDLEAVLRASWDAEVEVANAAPHDVADVAVEIYRHQFIAIRRLQSGDDKLVYRLQLAWLEAAVAMFHDIDGEIQLEVLAGPEVRAGTGSRLEHPSAALSGSKARAFEKKLAALRAQHDALADATNIKLLQALPEMLRDESDFTDWLLSAGFVLPLNRLTNWLKALAPRLHDPAVRSTLEDALQDVQLRFLDPIAGELDRANSDDLRKGMLRFSTNLERRAAVPSSQSVALLLKQCRIQEDLQAVASPWGQILSRTAPSPAAK